MNRQFKKEVYSAITLGIQRNVDRLFSISQQTSECYVPVDKGFLKKSGYVNYLPNGAECGYRTNYAAIVEFGIPEDIPITGTQIIRFKKKDGSMGERRYVNKRLIPIRIKYSKFEREKKPIFRVIDRIKKRPGQLFLTRAVMEGIKYITEDIKFFMRRLGAV